MPCAPETQGSLRTACPGWAPSHERRASSAARAACPGAPGEEEFDKLEGMHKEGYQLTGQKQPPLALEQIVAPHQTKTDGQQL